MKKLFLLLVLAGFSSVSFSQRNYPSRNGIVDENIDVMQVPVDKYKVQTNPFFDNIFFSAGGGAQILLGDQANLGKFGDRIAPALNVSVGKWFTPGLGLRIQYSGLQAKSFSKEQNPYSTNSQNSDGYYKDKWNYMNLHGDILFNASNMIFGYNPYRFYSAIPYVGFGIAHSWTKPHTTSLAFNFGMINSFRLTDAWDINLELFGMGVEDKFDAKTINGGIDVMLGVAAGVTFKLPQRSFQPAVDADAVMAMSASQIDAVNAALAQQIEQNQMLKNRMANMTNEKTVTVYKAPKPVVVEGTFKSIPQSIFFALGSKKVPVRQMVNLRQIADFMKLNPNSTINLTGFADSSTGNAALNRRLSEQRAEAVAQTLVKLGIDRNRMTVGSKGGVSTLTPPDLDRRVIMEVHNK